MAAPCSSYFGLECPRGTAFIIQVIPAGANRDQKSPRCGLLLYEPQGCRDERARLRCVIEPLKPVISVGIVYNRYRYIQLRVALQKRYQRLYPSGRRPDSCQERCRRQESLRDHDSAPAPLLELKLQRG